MIKVIAHRGISSAAEENTRQAFDLVVAHHLPIVEFDVQYTKDGIPVVFHDENTQRLCGVNKDIHVGLILCFFTISSFQNIEKTSMCEKQHH